MLKLAIAGCTGRMGQMLLREANKNPDVEIVGALTRSQNPFVGQDIGIFIGEEPFNLPVTDNPELAFKDADVVVDFSLPQGLGAHLAEVLNQKKPYVVGMTGFTEHQKSALEEASQHIPLLLAPNTSLGVALLRKLAVLSAEILGPSYDISILETHHRYKADAPSGAALSLAKALNTVEHLKECEPPYLGHSPRPVNTIECVSLRGGGIIGEHTLIFAGEKDVLKIEHRALDRALFAQGAIRAAEWLARKPAGLYSMDNVVGIS